MKEEKRRARKTYSSIKLDVKTAQRLRIFIASWNSGHIHGKIGKTVSLAINRYIDQEEEYIDNLALNAQGKIK